jgi:predicted CoA-binding protein
MSKLEQIHEFLAEKRLGMVGVSQKPQDFSRTLFKELRSRGYEVVPVNPAVAEVDGQICYKSVQEVQPPVSSVLLMTAPVVTEQVVRECAEAGVQRVWMYRATSQGAVSKEAVRFCETRGMAVIPGECPYMFLHDAGFGHKVHGWVRKIIGAYPK